MGPIGSNKGKRTLVAEINVTPLVDVMLVLLIMFIITIPVATHAVNIDLPNPAAPPPTIRTSVFLISLIAANPHL